jgi:hypothetical protein
MRGGSEVTPDEGQILKITTKHSWYGRGVLPPKKRKTSMHLETPEELVLARLREIINKTIKVCDGGFGGSPPDERKYIYVEPLDYYSRTKKFRQQKMWM